MKSLNTYTRNWKILYIWKHSYHRFAFERVMAMENGESVCSFSANLGNLNKSQESCSALIYLSVEQFAVGVDAWSLRLPIWVNTFPIHHKLADLTYSQIISLALSSSTPTRKKSSLHICAPHQRWYPCVSHGHALMCAAQPWDQNSFPACMQCGQCFYYDGQHFPPLWRKVMVLDCL